MKIKNKKNKEKYKDVTEFRRKYSWETMSPLFWPSFLFFSGAVIVGNIFLLICLILGLNFSVIIVFIVSLGTIAVLGLAFRAYGAFAALVRRYRHLETVARIKSDLVQIESFSRKEAQSAAKRLDEIRKVKKEVKIELEQSLSEMKENMVLNLTNLRNDFMDMLCNSNDIKQKKPEIVSVDSRLGKLAESVAVTQANTENLNNRTAFANSGDMSENQSDNVEKKEDGFLNQEDDNEKEIISRGSEFDGGNDENDDEEDSSEFGGY